MILFKFHLLQALKAVRNPAQNKSLCLPTWVLRVPRHGKPFAKLYVNFLGLLQIYVFILVMMILLRYEWSGNAEHAVEWLFTHPEDSGEDAAPTTSGDEATPASVPVRGLTSVPAKY
jgi:hypothetical protein